MLNICKVRGKRHSCVILEHDAVTSIVTGIDYMRHFY